jgi:hypothetical protein
MPGGFFSGRGGTAEAREARNKKAGAICKEGPGFLLVEASGIALPYESICCAAKRQKCPHRYPQIASPGFLSRLKFHLFAKPRAA